MRQIIFAWNYREWGGVQIYFLSIIKAVRHISAVHVVLPENSDRALIDKLKVLGAQCIYTKPVTAKRIPNGLFQSLRYKLDMMKSENQMVSTILDLASLGDTVIHADLGFWESTIPLVRLSAKNPVFVTVHTGLPRTNWLRDLVWISKGQIVSRRSLIRHLASNREARASLRRFLGGRTAAQIPVTYTGIDPDEIDAIESQGISREAIRYRFGISTGVLVVSVGQFIERKGCWVVGAALKELAEQGVQFTFLWLSTSEISEEIRSRVGNYGLGSSFQVLSPDDIGGSRMELLSIVRASDIFVMASRKEGLPIALTEAMALGVACIATAVNAVPEAIENEVTGLLIKPDNANSLAKAIGLLIEEPDKALRLGSAAKTRALSHFNQKSTAEWTVELYKSVWKT